MERKWDLLALKFPNEWDFSVEFCLCKMPIWTLLTNLSNTLFSNHWRRQSDNQLNNDFDCDCSTVQYPLVFHFNEKRNEKQGDNVSGGKLQDYGCPFWYLPGLWWQHWPRCQQEISGLLAPGRWSCSCSLSHSPEPEDAGRGEFSPKQVEVSKGKLSDELFTFIRQNLYKHECLIWISPDEEREVWDLLVFFSVHKRLKINAG